MLTLVATFTLGMGDAYTFMAHKQVFATAQTGNLVVFAVKLFTDGIGSAWENIPMWVIFGIGSFVAQGMLEIPDSKLSRRHQNKLFMATNVILWLTLAIIQYFTNSDVLVWPLSFLAAYELTTFRTVGRLSLNNGIMTGNTKNMMNSLYRWIFDQKYEDKIKFFTLLLVIVIFILGVGTGALLCNVNPHWALWTGFIINFIVLLSVLANSNAAD